MNYLWNIIQRYQQEIDKYKKRSAASIEYSKNINSDFIIGLKNIKGKIVELGNELGLGGNGISRYGYYSPTEQDGIFQLRISDHSNDNPSLYAKRELNGVPNVRNIIVFMGNRDTIETIPTNENHGVIVYRYVYVFPMYYLDYPNNVELLKESFDGMFRTGKFVPPAKFDKPSMQQVNNESKQYKTNTNMKRIRLTENQLHRVIKESVREVLKEEYNDSDDFDLPDNVEEYNIYKNGIAIVINYKNKFNLINRKGKLFFPVWFDYMGYWGRTYRMVKLYHVWC